MSHVGAAMDNPIGCLPAVREMCEAKGWTFHEGQQTYRWYGTWVGDTAPTRALFETDEEFQRVLAMRPNEQMAYMTALSGKCDHAISIPGCQYQIGLRARKDGTFTPVWDYYGPGGLLKALGGEKAPVLAEAYDLANLKYATRQAGGIVAEETVLENGDVRLRLLAPAGY